HFGSRVAAAAKVFSDSVYWNEWRSATPFSITGCTSAVQLVGKFTLPSCSGGAADKLSARSAVGCRARIKKSSPKAELDRNCFRITLPPVAVSDSTSGRRVWRIKPFGDRAPRRLDALWCGGYNGNGAVLRSRCGS